MVRFSLNTLHRLSLMLLAVLEGWSRLLGWYDFAVKHDRHVVWDMAYTQKHNVHSLRQNQDAEEGARPVALAGVGSNQRRTNR